MSWTTAALGDFAQIFSGFAFKSDRFNSFGEGLPLVRIRDVTRGASDTYYDGDFAERFVVNDGDLLVGMDGEFNCAPWAGGRALLNQRVCKVTASDMRLDQGYLRRFLPIALKVIEDRTNFVTVKHLSSKDIATIEIPLPPLQEQRRIAAILDQADALRRLRRQSLLHLSYLRQSIFDDMFGKSASAKNPSISRLGDIAELINGDRSSNYPSAEDIRDKGIPFLSTVNIQNGHLDLSKCNYITEEKFKSLTRGKLARNDIIITLRGTLGQCAMFDCRFETGFINAQMMIIRSSDSIVPRYLAEFISLPLTQQHLKASNSGTAVPQLTAAQMKELKIIVPELAAQRKFVQRFDAARHILLQNSAHLTQLDTLFASLQHRAFRGEL